MKHREIQFKLRIPQPEWSMKAIRRVWVPTPGNVLFTLLMIGLLLWAQSAGALPLRLLGPNVPSTTTIAYQGRLADAGGSPLTGAYSIIFRLYNAASGGAPLWEEQWTGQNGVQVSDGLFNVMLGSLTPIPQAVVTGNSTLWLGITVGTDDEMAPRVQLGSVPFAVQALTVPDGSVTTGKIADEAVTTAKIADRAVTQAKLTAHIQTYQAVVDWSWQTSSTEWTRVGNLAVTFSVEHESLLIMTANGHINSDDPENPWLYSGFFIDNTHVSVDPAIPLGMLGDYHVYEDNTNGGWFPWCFVQLGIVMPGTHTVEVKTMTAGGTWNIHGAAIQVAVIPK
ncbi:MAG: hypothetical protein WBE17_11945 [Anaerolineae bacterium]